MPDLQDVLKQVGSITAAIVALVGLFAAIVKLWDKLRQLWKGIIEPLWNNALKPVAKWLAFLGTQFVPNGIVVWVLLYKTAAIADRVSEPAVFLALVAEATVAISAYAIVWGIWLCPWLRRWLVSSPRGSNQDACNKLPRADCLP